MLCNDGHMFDSKYIFYGQRIIVLYRGVTKARINGQDEHIINSISLYITYIMRH